MDRSDQYALDEPGRLDALDTGPGPPRTVELGETGPVIRNGGEPTRG